MAVQSIPQLITGSTGTVPQAAIEQPVPMMAGIAPATPTAPGPSWSGIICSINQAVTNHPVLAVLGIVAGYFVIRGEKKPTHTRRTR